MFPLDEILEMGIYENTKLIYGANWCLFNHFIWRQKFVKLDMIFFDKKVVHAAFGGKTGRRVVSMHWASTPSGRGHLEGVKTSADIKASK